MNLTNDVLKSDYDVNLVPKDLKTQIITHYHITGNNLILEINTRTFKVVSAKGSQTQLDLLKVEIETGDLKFD